MVPYGDAEHDTLTQVDRATRATAGDVQARLEMLSNAEVESKLRDIYLDGSSESSVLHALQSPPPDRTQADVLRLILEDIGDKVEGTALTAAYVWRYAQVHQLWRTHANPELHREEAFLDSLDHGALIKVGIALGTSTMAARRGSLRIIQEHWGEDWFERIPSEIRPPYKDPSSAPKRLLYAIAANCKSGLTLDDATTAWQAAISVRTDPDTRTRTRTRAPRTQYLTAQDAAYAIPSINVDPAKPIAEHFFPELQEDRLALKPLRPRKRQRRGSSTYKPGLRRSDRVRRGDPLVEDEATVGRRASDTAGSPGSDVVLDIEGEDATSSPPNERCQGISVARAVRVLLSVQDELQDGSLGVEGYCNECLQYVRKVGMATTAWRDSPAKEAMIDLERLPVHSC